MKQLILAVFGVLGITTLNAQTRDTLTVNKNPKVRTVSAVPVRIAPQSVSTDLKLGITGEFRIASYTILISKSPSKEELNGLVGSLVKIQSTSITGALIDPLTFSIYEIERLKKDDYIFRAFGNDIKTSEIELPESFNVHKTDNDRCYGIIELGDGRVVIPYKGVLLFLTRN